MLQQVKNLNREFIAELTNSPYWHKKRVIKKGKALSQYSIHFYNNDFLVTTEIDGDGVLYFINNENDFPINSARIKSLLKRIRLERELKGWKIPSVRKYNQIRAEILNEMLTQE